MAVGVVTETEAERKLSRTLARVRAHASRLLELQDITAQASVSSPELQATAAKSAIANATSKTDSVELLKGFADLVFKEAEAADLEIEQVGLVERLKSAQIEAGDGWPSAEDRTPAMIEAAASASEHLRVVVLTSSELVLERELREELDDLSSGQYFALADLYDRYELGDDERTRLTRRLAERPRAIPSSVVDVANQSVIRLPSPGWSRVWRYAAPGSLVVACVGLLYALSAVFGSDSGLGDFGDLLQAAGLVSAGVLLHLFIDGKKGRKYKWATEVAVVSKWSDWLLLHPFACCRYSSRRWTIIGLRWLKVDLGQEATYILAGFGADSVADALFARVNDLSARTTKTITAKL